MDFDMEDNYLIFLKSRIDFIEIDLEKLGIKEKKISLLGDSKFHLLPSYLKLAVVLVSLMLAISDSIYLIKDYNYSNKALTNKDEKRVSIYS
jgi:hypothetical protein